MDTTMRDSSPTENGSNAPPIPSLEFRTDVNSLPEVGFPQNQESIYIQLQTTSTGQPHGDGLSREISPQQRSSSSSSITPSDLSDDQEDYSVPLHSVLTEKPTKALAFPYTSRRSGLVYDVRMRHHTEIEAVRQHDDDELGSHPEDPKRIFEIFRELEDAGLVTSYEDGMKPDSGDHRLWRIPARRVSKEEACLVHAGFYYDGLKELSSKSEIELYVMAAEMDSVYLHWETFSCAELSAGGAIEACRAVVTGTVKNAIAVIRPPGHHAEHDVSRGFCFFNNVAIAARVCQQDFPDLCKKVLIVDWDVHHGNGIQQAFYNDPNVLYISLHVHQGGGFYPAGDYGDHLHCGEGPGLGYNVNIPWKLKGMGDGDYILAFQQILMPIAIEFDPDLVIVAAGFDAADGDTLGGCHVMPAGYAHMTHMLKSLAKGKIAVCLEGGYNLRSIAKSALAVTRTLMGEPPDRLGPIEPSPSGVATIQSVIATQSEYWTSLYPKNRSKTGKGKIHGARLHDVVRTWQTREFWKEFQMSPLFILRDYVSPSFANQVVATSNYDQARPLLVIVHDPPEPIDHQDPNGKKMQLHNMWLSDPAKFYVEEAIKLGFAVIDVNVPMHITDPQDDVSGYLEPDEDRVRRSATRELMTYLWNNYIEVNEAPHIFLMGIGSACCGIIDLLSTMESSMDRISGIYSFVQDAPLEQIKRPADDLISAWYYEHSLVFVASEHPVWARKKKMGRKYGDVMMTKTSTIRQMLVETQDRVMSELEEGSEEWRTQNGVHSTRGRLSRSSEESLSSLADESFEMKMSEADAAVFGAP